MMGINLRKGDDYGYVIYVNRGGEDGYIYNVYIYMMGIYLGKMRKLV